jgi:hypothetical protein
MMVHFAAAHESGNGTFRTWRARCAMSVSWGRADVVQEDADERQPFI